MDLNNSTKPAGGNFIIGVNWPCPAEEPVGILTAHVDTAMTHRRSKIFVPVRAMKGVTQRSEEGCPGDAGKYIIIYIGQKISGGFAAKVAIPHMLRGIFFQNEKLAVRRGGFDARAAGWVAGNAG